VAGIVVSAITAAVIGFFSIRVSGIPFLMLTMAFSQLLMSISIRWRSVTGGTDGLSGFQRPSLFGISLDNRTLQFYVIAVGFLLVVFFLRRLIASPLGSIFIGIRENESRMRAAGYPVQRFKLISFTLAGALAGVGGGLYALSNAFVSSDILHWALSGDAIIMVILGGTGTIIGPVFGSRRVPVAQERRQLAHRILAALGRHHLHPVRDVPAPGRLGLAGRAPARNRNHEHRRACCAPSALHKAVRQPRRHQEREPRSSTRASGTALIGPNGAGQNEPRAPACRTAATDVRPDSVLRDKDVTDTLPEERCSSASAARSRRTTCSARSRCARTCASRCRPSAADGSSACAPRRRIARCWPRPTTCSRRSG
jgi:hypothetical protein